MTRVTLKLGFLSVAIPLIASGINYSAPVLAQSATAAATPAATNSTFPALTGKYKVGRVEYEWVDTSRDETNASVPGLKRDMMAYIYFPATPPKRAKIAPYMDGGFMWGIWSSQTTVPESQIQAHSYNTNVIDPAQATYPVILFDPGPVFTSLNYASVIEDLVSHGYVVIGMSHPYLTSVIAYPDGRLVTEALFDFSPGLIADWMKDIQFAIDQTTQLNTSDKLFKGHLDVAHLGLLGHSGSGFFTVEATTLDKQIIAGATLDALYDPNAKPLTSDPIGKPFLFVNTGVIPTNVPASKGAYSLMINGGGFANPTDFPYLKIPVPTLLGDMSKMGISDPPHYTQILDSHLVAFFDNTLKGAPLTWPSDPDAKVIDLSGSAATATP